jgi:peptide deformylase
MAILKIARMGHPVLRKPARPVKDPGAPEVRRLVEDMLETMVDAEGTGLAAPQVYVPLRIVIFFVARERPEANEDRRADRDDESEDGSPAVPLTVLINPQWEPLSEEMEMGPEACLSVPGLMGNVPRYRKIRYRGLTPEGRDVAREAEGFHARVVQHECDHLDGLLYPQRMRDAASLIFASEAGARFSEKDALRRYGLGE